ncbi:hypothetical protein BST47_29530 [Mycolicibacterium tusciae]|uniref:Uncharacterized protein n=2 Tax=Mycolicibacterium tusciae TaxID=75922 RepID=A0A1X0JD94_9MYCO|nr:hypothetical protein BST47_29530 [Mycolicibacterium tusciae]
MDDEMTFKVAVPRDAKGRVLLSDSEWSARLDSAIEHATENEGGAGAWGFVRVQGHDEDGNALIKLRRFRPGERPLPAGPVEERPAVTAARAEAARRDEQRRQTREQNQRGGYER